MARALTLEMSNRTGVGAIGKDGKHNWGLSHYSPPMKI